MRIEGKLSKWNEERGFGFVSTTQGESEVFVHISAFPRDGSRPRVGERLSFEIDAGNNGKARAINLVCLDRQVQYFSPLNKRPPRQERRSILAKVISLAVVLALVFFGHAEYSRRSNAPPAVMAQSVMQTPQALFQCDGRTMCSQMASCAEATFFLKNCPNVKMDGDYDGIPCEQQLCSK
jgi:cold shock CspA family protein